MINNSTSKGDQIIRIECSEDIPCAMVSFSNLLQVTRQSTKYLFLLNDLQITCHCKNTLNFKRLVKERKTFMWIKRKRT